MPIVLPHPIKALAEKEFHQLDYDVMALAFEVQNELGRLYCEKIYQNALTEKCKTKGLQIDHELEIRLIHNDYVKSLFIDLLIENSVYELKAIHSIHEEQRLQTLNYLFSSNTQHGKIINFRPASVEHEFVSTSLNHSERKQFKTECKQWRALSKEAAFLKTTMLELFEDWGAFFSSQLYEEAIIHALGGEEMVVRPIDIRNNHFLGTQKLNTLSSSEIFMITATRNNTSLHQKNLKKLLKHTSCSHLYWINLNHTEAQFTTLEK